MILDGLCFKKGLDNRKANLRDEIDAAKAYDKAARKYHKEFAVVNFEK